MSCAIFTVIGFLAAILNESNRWVVLAMMGWLRFNFGDLDQALLKSKANLPAFAELAFGDSRGKVHFIRGDIKLQLNKVIHRSEVEKM